MTTEFKPTLQEQVAWGRLQEEEWRRRGGGDPDELFPWERLIEYRGIKIIHSVGAEYTKSLAHPEWLEGPIPDLFYVLSFGGHIKDYRFDTLDKAKEYIEGKYKEFWDKMSDKEREKVFENVHLINLDTEEI